MFALDAIGLPTLGGRQFWADHLIHAGWRIQENTWTGKFRLLDPNDRLEAKGSWDYCRSIFDYHAWEGFLSWPSDHLVILVHGLCRTKGAYWRFGKALSERGIAVQAINYPSTQFSIEDHASQLNKLLSRLEGVRKVSFVTHSLGGIVVRAALAKHHGWMERLDVGTVLQIAPPNQGAKIAQFLKPFAPFNWISGPVGKQLANGISLGSPAPQTKFCVIAGGRGTASGFNLFFQADNDGLVCVDETRLDI